MPRHLGGTAVLDFLTGSSASSAVTTAPWGIPHLHALARTQVDMANILVTNTITILRLAQQLHIPWVVENPLSSLLWHTSVVAGAFDKWNVEFVKLHMCAFGSRWRKATSLATSRLINPQALAGRCVRLPDGKCSHSGSHHIQLSGRDPFGVLWTRRAQSYPKPFCRAAAGALYDAGFAKEFVTLADEYMGLLRPNRALGTAAHDAAKFGSCDSTRIA